MNTLQASVPGTAVAHNHETPGSTPGPATILDPRVLFAIQCIDKARAFQLQQLKFQNMRLRVECWKAGIYPHVLPSPYR